MVTFWDRIRSSAFLKDGAWLVAANAGSAGFGFLTLLLISRTLGPDRFGVFSTASAVLMLILEMSDLGINSGLIRFTTPLLARGEHARAADVLGLAARSRVVISVVVTVTGLLSSQFLAKQVFHSLSLKPLIDQAFIGFIPVMLLSLLGAVLQAHQRFRAFSATNLISGAVKLLLVFILLCAHRLTPASSLWAIIIGPAVGAVAAWIMIPKGTVRFGKADSDLAAQLRTFSGWMTVWALAISLLSRLDTLMLQRSLGALSVGIYSAGFQLAYAFTLVVTAFGTVLTPRITTLSTEQLRQIFSRFWQYAALVGALALIVIAAGSLLVPSLFGEKYLASIPIFRLIMVGQFFYGLSIIPDGILYAMNRPVIFATNAVIQLILKYALNLWLIPRYGVQATGFSFIAVNLLAVALPFFYLVIYFKRHPNERTT